MDKWNNIGNGTFGRRRQLLQWQPTITGHEDNNAILPLETDLMGFQTIMAGYHRAGVAGAAPTNHPYFLPLLGVS